MLRERQKRKVPSLRLATCPRKDRDRGSLASIQSRVNEQLCLELNLNEQIVNYM